VALGGDVEPLGGLHWFRLAALGAAPGDSVADYDLCTLL